MQLSAMRIAEEKKQPHWVVSREEVELTECWQSVAVPQAAVLLQSVADSINIAVIIHYKTLTHANLFCQLLYHLIEGFLSIL